MGGRRMVARLAEQKPNITLGTHTRPRARRVGGVRTALRLGIDYLRYLDPRYAETPHLRTVRAIARRAASWRSPNAGSERPRHVRARAANAGARHPS
jgi:hypothetical protein